MFKVKQKSDKLVIDLTGPDGNANYLLGAAKHLSNQLGLDSDKVTKQMKSKDYEHLLKVFDGYFGDFVILLV